MTGWSLAACRVFGVLVSVYDAGSDRVFGIALQPALRKLRFLRRMIWRSSAKGPIALMG